MKLAGEDGRCAARRWGVLSSRFAREQDGATAIEFAMLAMPFFLLVFAVIENCVAFAAQQVISNALDDVSRQVRTTSMNPKFTPATLKAAVCAEISVIVPKSCAGLEVDLRSYATYAAAAADGYVVDKANGDEPRDKIFIYSKGKREPLKAAPGGSLTINTMRIFYRWPVMTDIMRRYIANIDGNKTLLYATTTWKNEPYNE